MYSDNSTIVFRYKFCIDAIKLQTAISKGDDDNLHCTESFPVLIRVDRSICFSIKHH